MVEKRGGYNASQGDPKRQKGHDGSAKPSGWEAELANMDGNDIDEFDEGVLAEARPDAIFESRDEQKRKVAPALDTEKDSLIFQQIDIDLTSLEPISNLSAVPRASVNTVITLYGVTESGHSVAMHVHGFLPYFYFTAPPAFSVSDCETVKVGLNNAAKDLSASKDPKKDDSPIIKVEMVTKQSLMGYTKTKERNFFKVTCLNPAMVTRLRGICETGFHTSDNRFIQGAIFEGNIEFILRFMIDLDIVGCSWIEMPPGTYHIRNEKTQYAKRTLCQYEVDVNYKDIIAHAAQGDWMKLAPLRILSFDIECKGEKNAFPDPDRNPVIQIGNMCSVQGTSRPFVRTIFTLGSCANIVGSEVRSFDDEKEMLEAWADFVTQIDPDILTGYNIIGFDLPYIINRATKLGAKNALYLSRDKHKKTVIQQKRFSSKAYGTRNLNDIKTPGRCQFDVIQVLQRDYKLRSYSLNAVSAEFLGEQKEDVPHSIIADLQDGNDNTRRRLAVYCLKDSYLPLRLLDKLMCVINYIEMSRVTGVPFSFLLSRGQQIKVVSQLYRKCKDVNILIPTVRSDPSGDQYEGATVIEPQAGYYDVPIATLDFASLYPSIMQAHNLCYTTLVDETTARTLPGTDYIKTPAGHYFVKNHVRQGILPTILTDLLAARKQAKKDLKAETDPFKKAVLDGRQLALKVSANSVYGFTGATAGRLPCLPISSSVTSFGRQMIDQTKNHVEAKYPNSTVVYGDTDSVMINFGETDMDKVFEFGEEAAEFVSSKFLKPIKLEFEKVYWPFLLISKKRYAGLYWTNTKKWDKLDAKGIETVRRDNCQLVKQVIATCLDKILIDRDVDGAVDYAKRIIAELLQNKVDISQLVISKALSKSAEDMGSKQAHVELAERMRKRDPGSAPVLGDRVPYVIIRKDAKARAYEKAEDPLYVLQNNIPIDTKYYLENQLANPLTRIFEPILRDKVSTLLTGDHTRKVTMATPSGNTGLMKFAKKITTCLNCKVPLKAGEHSVCAKCKDQEGFVYARELEHMGELEAKFANLWTECQRCQNSLIQDVVCTSKDCPIFYMRKRVQKDMVSQRQVLDRFGEVW
eukprot:Clim_evm27s164 gene=Clim_evmTU27s164